MTAGNTVRNPNNLSEKICKRKTGGSWHATYVAECCISKNPNDLDENGQRCGDKTRCRDTDRCFIICDRYKCPVLPQ